MAIHPVGTKTFAGLCALAAVLAGVPTPADAGPSSVLAIAVDSGASNFVYVASPDGLYRSDNGGMTWALVTTLPAGIVTNVMAPPLEPGVVYASAGGLLLKSADRGATWGSTGQAGASVIVADPSRAGMVYANGGADGPNLAKSLDGGLTWLTVAILDVDAQQPGATVTTSVSRLVIDVRAPDVLYAVAKTTVTSGGGSSVTYDKVFKSFTGGAYWQAVPLGTKNLAIRPQTSDLWFSIGSMVYLSSNGGATADPIFEAYRPPTAIAFNPRHPVMFVPTADYFHYGEVSTSPFRFNSSFTIGPARTVGPDILTFDPASADVVYAGSACGWPAQPIRSCVPLAKSLDGGRTWREIADGYYEQTLISIAAAPANSRVLFAESLETRNGRLSYVVKRSDDAGATWSEGAILPADQRPYQALFSPSTSSIVALDEWRAYGVLPESISRTIDGARSFQEYCGSISQMGVPTTISLTDSGTAYALMEGTVPRQTVVLRMPFGGGCFNALQSLSMSNIRPAGIYVPPTSDATVYLVLFTDNTLDRIYKSTNAGSTFSPLPFDPGQPIVSMAFDRSAANHVYIATGTPRRNDGRVLESTDGGVSWTPLGPSDSSFDIRAMITLGSDVYVADRRLGVLVFNRTTNNWQRLGYVGATMLTAGGGSTPTLYAGTPSGAVCPVVAPGVSRPRLDRTSAAVGLPLTFSGPAACGTQEYRFRRYDQRHGWTVLQDYSISPAYTWVPGDLDVGPQLIEISVRAAGTTDAVSVDYTELFIGPRPDPVIAIPFRYDGDFYRDVFVYDRVTGAWKIHKGNPMGQFDSGPSGGWNAGWDISVGDFNGDGRDDFFLYSSVSGVWFKVINKPAGFTYFSQGWQPGFNIHILDLNRDGRDDVFAHNPASGAGYACISLGDGTSVFDYTPTQFDPGFRVQTADFNGFFRDDLFIHRPIGGEFYKVMSRGDGTFDYYGGGWAPGWTSYVAYLDRDTHSDVFLYNAVNGVSYVALSTGDGTGGFDYGLKHWRAGWQIHSAQFDFDGTTDLFLYDGASWEKVLTGTTYGWTHVPGGWARWTISVADLNGDGRSDVLLFDPATGQWYQALTTTPDAFTYISGRFQ